MALSEAQVQFIRTYTSYAKKYNAQYQIHDECVVAIVAQACNESSYGQSDLATMAYNFNGMKAGSSWTGDTIQFYTWEELPDGTRVQVLATWRKYPDFETGVKAYFEFIQYPRYHNLRDCTTPREYLETIKADGYATSSSYVNDIMRVVTQINYLVNDTPADSNPQPPQPPPPYGDDPLHYDQKVEIAFQVINGDWGSRDIDIENNLTQAGYNYEDIMNTVNTMLVTTSYLRKNRKRR